MLNANVLLFFLCFKKFSGTKFLRWRSLKMWTSTERPPNLKLMSWRKYKKRIQWEDSKIQISTGCIRWIGDIFKQLLFVCMSYHVSYLPYPLIHLGHPVHIQKYVYDSFGGKSIFHLQCFIKKHLLYTYLSLHSFIIHIPKYLFEEF